MLTSSPSAAVAQASASKPQPRLQLRALAQVDSGPSDADRWLVDVRPGVIANNPARLTIDLPDGTSIEALRSSWHAETSGVSWVGRSNNGAGTPTLVVLSLADGRLAGIVETGKARYRVLPDPSGHRVERDVDRAVECSGVWRPPVELSVGVEERDLASEDADTTDLTSEGPVLEVLVAYTTRGAQEVDGGIRAHAQASVQFLNEAFHNSRVVGEARLAGAFAVDSFDAMEQSGRIHVWDYLVAAVDDPELARLRSETGADVVELYVGKNVDGCGQAVGLLSTDTAASAAHRAFGVTSVNCGYYTFAHEVGHNLGLGHDPANASADSGYHPWARGYLADDYRTIMSYGRVPRIPYFSNPAVDSSGRRTGVAGVSDNARTLATTLSIASRFVVGGSPPQVSPPTDLTAELETPTSVVLRWADPSDEESGFRVEHNVEREGWRPVVTTAADTTEVLIDDLRTGAEHRFRVRTLGEGVRSTPSAVVSIRTPAGALPPARLFAEPMSTTEIQLRWTSASSPSDIPATLVIERRTPGAPDLDYQLVATVEPYTGAENGTYVVKDLEAETAYAFRARVADSGASGASRAGPLAAATTLGAVGPCRTGGPFLCLLDGRFELRVDWDDPNGSDSGVGTARSIVDNDQSGLFWFFDAANIELVVKMFDVAFTESVWLYYGALSDVEYWISVRDTATDERRTYYNPAKSLCGLGDVAAFASPVGATPDFAVGADEPSPGRAVGLNRLAHGSSKLSPPTSPEDPAPGLCTATDETLCLADGRFAVDVDFQVETPPRDDVGHPLPELATADAGFFWFFDADNIELTVKILDGREVTGNFWLFWGALSDVAYQLRVTDTVDGSVHVFENPAGTLCGGSVLNTL